MNPPLPRPKPVVYVISLVVGLTLMALTAWLSGNDHQTYGWRLGHGIVQTGAAIALGVFSASGLIELWQRRQWRRRNQLVAFDLFRRAMRQTAIIASRAVWVFTGDRNLSDEVYSAYDRQLPWSHQRTEGVQGVKDELSKQLLTTFANPPEHAAGEGSSSELRGIVERAARAEPELESRSDRLRSIAEELSPYVDPDDATDVFIAVVELDAQVRKFNVQLPGAPNDLWATLQGLGSTVVLDASQRVAETLSDAYLTQRKRTISDDKLAEKLAWSERAAAEADEADHEFREFDRQWQELSQESDRLAGDADRERRELQETIQALKERDAPNG